MFGRELDTCADDFRKESKAFQTFSASVSKIKPYLNDPEYKPMHGMSRESIQKFVTLRTDLEEAKSLQAIYDILWHSKFNPSKNSNFNKLTSLFGSYVDNVYLCSYHATQIISDVRTYAIKYEIPLFNEELSNREIDKPKV